MCSIATLEATASSIRNSATFLCLMVFLAARGMGKIIARIPPKYMDYMIGAVLFLTAATIVFV